MVAQAGTMLRLKSFLAVGKQALHRLRRTSKTADSLPGEKLLLVVGNQSADLDSLISSLILSYAWSSLPFQSPGRAVSLPPAQATLPSRALFPVPVLPIERKNLRLRPEFKAALRTVSITPDELITLDDLGIYPDQNSREEANTGAGQNAGVTAGDECGSGNNRASINDSISPDQVSIVLVDHNQLMPPLHPSFDDSVLGCIDHHVDERKVSSACQKWQLVVVDEPVSPRLSAPAVVPHVITPTGSCTSHVVRWCVDNGIWPNVPSGPEAKEDGDNLGRAGDCTHNALSLRAEEIAVCQLAMASILVDTVNMTADYKITEHDRWAMEFLRSRLDGRIFKAETNNKDDADGDELGAGAVSKQNRQNSFNETAWFNELREAATDISSLALWEIFERDYKEWESLSDTTQAGVNQMVVGIAVAERPLQYLADKAIEEVQPGEVSAPTDKQPASLTGIANCPSPFLSQIQSFARDRKLDIFAVMTAFNGERRGGDKTTDSSTADQGEFRRQLLVYTTTTQGSEAVESFVSQQMMQKNKQQQTTLSTTFSSSPCDICLHLEELDSLTFSNLFLNKQVEASEQSSGREGNGFHLRVWEQVNTQYGRKQIAPLLRLGMDSVLGHQQL